MGFVMKVKLTETLRDGTLMNYYENSGIAGYQFDVRLAYYRGHYLSVIDQLKVEVDHQEVEDQDIRFCINGKEFAVWELREAFYEFWSIKDAAVIKVCKDGGLTSGEHNVKLTLMFRCPYLPLPGAEYGYTPVDSCDEKVMTLVEHTR
ncbi:MAG: DUF6379 domain-containing protein [Clostridiales bacterium]|nr:DUF6379 domain-containing protein [Clostridiales bacterium]